MGVYGRESDPEAADLSQSVSCTYVVAASDISWTELLEVEGREINHSVENKGARPEVGSATYRRYVICLRGNPRLHFAFLISPEFGLFDPTHRHVKISSAHQNTTNTAVVPFSPRETIFPRSEPFIERTTPQHENTQSPSISTTN